jgi:Ni/Co efflux regulator RcnB
MKRLLIASALMMAGSGVAAADERWKDAREADRARYEAQREYAKARDEARREAAKDQREAEREYRKDRREAAREYEKDRREAVREFEQDRREYRKELAKSRREWARGQHLPGEYLDDRYFIDDYRAYDLAPPPRGYVWVRPDPRDEEIYLVQMATGVIARILGH